MSCLAKETTRTLHGKEGQGTVKSNVVRETVGTFAVKFMIDLSNA